jgi:predicted  nucleic acid-binding Zn-ribbon protein
LAAWFTLNARVDMAAQAIVRLEKVVDHKADKEAASRGELELSRRIVETQQNQNSALVRIDAGFAEIKTMLRDVERKLDTKADKPGR